MDKNITNLGHLRSAMQETKRQTASTLGAVADAIEEMAGAIVTEEQMSAIVKEAVQDALGGSSSSGGVRPDGSLDPVEVYKNTRPADWLPMPEPADDEMYLLFHIPDGMSALLAFTATCTGDYTVELGTIANGIFVPSSSTSIASAEKYEAELFAGDYENLTASGMKQVMIKITGTDILTWEPSAHTAKSGVYWNIVEIACRLPKSTQVKCSALDKLAYYAQYGTNAITNMYAMFRYCYSLVAVLQLDTVNATRVSSMFSGCYSLIAVPQFNTTNITQFDYMFENCWSLTAVPQFDTTKATTVAIMFAKCYSLRSVPQFELPVATRLENMFKECYSLTTIQNLYAPRVQYMDNMFSGCRSLTVIEQLWISGSNGSGLFSGCGRLAKLTLRTGTSTWSGYAISLANCSLGHPAIVEFFESLRTVTTERAITLTGNPGVSELTEEEKAIATDKGWTLTL